MQGASMLLNIRRGLSRAYLLLSVLWFLAAASCSVTYANEINASGAVALLAISIVGLLPPVLLYLLGWTIAGFGGSNGERALPDLSNVARTTKGGIKIP